MNSDLKIKIDVSGSKNISEALGEVAKVLGLVEYHKNSLWIVNSLDAFDDSFQSLHTESEVYKKSGKPSKVHIDFLGVERAKKNMPKQEGVRFSDMDIFLDIMNDASGNKERYDKVDFSYTIVD